MTDNILIDELTLSRWRQFNNVEIAFHDRLTILTGANGAGKSTILKILKSHFPYESDEQFLSTPIQEAGATRFSAGNWFSNLFGDLFPPKVVPTNTTRIGQVVYSNESICSLTLPQQDSMQYALVRSQNQPIPGVSIKSHRAIPKYDQLKNIPISGVTPAEAQKLYFELEKSYSEQSFFHRDGNLLRVGPLAAIKEALITFATFGIGNAHVAPIPELAGLYERFQGILGAVLPPEIGFQKLEIRTPEVVIISSSGSFPIDGASGGLMSLIQLSWQIFLQSEIYKSNRFMVLIDEPENHLHPSMQRSYLKNIVEAFPQARFVVATHSPFIISSVKDSYVYALQHMSADSSTLKPLEARSVTSHKLDALQKAGPASDILREVLGVPVTMPEWSAKEIERIASVFAAKKMDAEALKSLRNELNEAGLSDFYPDALERIVK
ncbi:AAA family ATPase [Agrobacterium tumefaciens]|nr:AAA family ATPase [Agrobacterium tumefaciens]